MIRSLAIAASLLLMSTVTLSAQHPSPHQQGRSHDGSGHEPMDPAMHAALHAMMHGDWHGTISAPDRGSQVVDLAVGKDKNGQALFRMTGRNSQLGTSSGLAFDGRTVKWRQDVAGTPCRSVASFIAATADMPDTLRGSMSCANGEMSFALQRNAK